MEVLKIFYTYFFGSVIEAMGYDPQRALLEVRFLQNGEVKQYENVPEEVWYYLRENRHPDMYYRRYICGHYKELEEAEV